MTRRVDCCKGIRVSCLRILVVGTSIRLNASFGSVGILSRSCPRHGLSPGTFALSIAVVAFIGIFAIVLIFSALLLACRSTCAYYSPTRCPSGPYTLPLSPLFTTSSASRSRSSTNQ